MTAPTPDRPDRERVDSDPDKAAALLLAAARVDPTLRAAAEQVQDALLQRRAAVLAADAERADLAALLGVDPDQPGAVTEAVRALVEQRDDLRAVLREVADDLDGRRLPLVDIIANARELLAARPGAGTTAAEPRLRQVGERLGDCLNCTTPADVCSGVSGCCESCAEIGRLTMHASTTAADPDGGDRRG